VTTSVFASAVEAYYRAGWPAILPVPPDAKWPPPVGYTGEHGADTPPQQLAAWAANGYRDHSIALRMPDGVIGIDVDDYIKGEVTKTGLATLAAKIAEWGPLPATWCSTARGSIDGPVHGGILFLRVPPGRYATVLGPDVEIIQRHHRYAVVAPSWNSDADARYGWYQQATLHPSPVGIPAAVDDVPSPTDLPWAPATWVEGLRAGATPAGPLAADPASGEHLLTLLRRDGRDPCADVADALGQTDIKLSSADAGARHDTMTARVHRLVHLGASGHPGLGHALDRLRAQWLDLTAGEDREGEFDRMLLTSARKAVTAVGPVPVDRDPCLMLGGFTVTPPAPVDDRSDDDPRQPPLPGPIGEPIPYSWRHVIGTHPFDPAADLDQTLAVEVLHRTWPMLRHASDTKNGWLLRGPTHWELHGDLTRRAISEVAGLMPTGDPTKPGTGEPPSPEQRQAARRARFHTNATAAAISGAMRAVVLGGYHPSAVRLADLDTDPEVLWAGGMPYDLRASINGPTFAHVELNTPHLVSAGVAPDLRPTPRWDALLAAVWPDDQVRAWALRVLSIGLTGHPDAALPILLGVGGTGKTSVIELIMSVLGSYAHAANVKLLSGENSHDSIIYALKGRRLSFIDEGPREGRWAQERLKQLTGGGQLTGNAMNQNPITFSPTHTLVLTSNTEPALTDEAVRRRVRLIPCEGDATAVRAARAAITPSIWATEAPGVLAQLMSEAAAWLADPDSALTSAAPESIRGRADEIATEQDLTRRWVHEACEPCEQGNPSRQLYTWFVGWCRDGNTHPSRIPTETSWGRALTALGYPVTHSRQGKRRSLRICSDGGLAASHGPNGGGDGFVGPGDGLVTGSRGNPSHPYNPHVNPCFFFVGDGCDGFSPYEEREERRNISER
jgi:P4 family phage/plasmid primase-like protien